MVGNNELIGRKVIYLQEFPLYCGDIYKYFSVSALLSEAHTIHISKRIYLNPEKIMMLLTVFNSKIVYRGSVKKN